ncbi:hypothetical protein HCN44_001847 [Aphidius gifuensis]|uniref:Uncharacterized protein n=1 Tax=Aphidius gifuensis TaxID=684658 RepID=A0A835CX67_APHGI|nr:hypothetical protein HCN44_001847 [Aphidius gifuensis]
MKESLFNILLLVFSLNQLVFGDTDNNVSVTCQTKACVHAAARIIKMVDLNVDPCDDFYKFTCGGVLNSEDIFDELNNRFDKSLEFILKQNTSINEPKYLKIAKTLYRICENKNYASILNPLESNGGWPVLKGSRWMESDFDLTKINFDCGSFCTNTFFKIGINCPFFIEVEPLSSELSVEDYVQGRNNTNVDNYYNEMIQIVEKMGAAKNNINYKDDLDKILDFEVELGRTRLLTEQKLNGTHDTVEMTLHELTNNYSLFFNLPMSDFEPSTTVHVTNFSYMKKLQSLVNSTETKRTLANFIMWKYVRNILNNDIDKNTLKKCVDVVSYRLPHAVGAIYVQNYSQPGIIEVRDNIINMTLIIKQTFLKMMKKADWIDEETKNEITKKLELSKYVIGCINELNNNSKIDKFYESLELFDYESFDNACEKIRQFTDNTRSKDNWDFFVANMGESPARFFSPLNTIIISYMMLDKFFFDSVRPNYMNYGSLGSKINEIIADNGGIRAAYRAYNELSNDEKQLPGLPFTPKQMFWISYASKYCGKTIPKTLRIGVSDHPINKFRVIGTSMNLPEFAEDFQCPSGSKMNPVKKCSVW